MKKILSILSMLSFFSYSQEKIVYKSDSDLFKEFDSLSKLEKYDQLLNLFQTVNPNDSISTSVKISDTYYKLKLKKYSEVIEVCKNEIPKHKGAQLLSFYTNKAVAHAGLKETDSVITTYTNALERFPKNSNLYLRRGNAYRDKGDLIKSYEDLQSAFLANPFDVSVHLYMGDLFYSQNKLSQALMAYNFYLLISPDGENSYEVLNYFNDRYASKNKNQSSNKQITSNDKLFKSIDVLIENRIAINKKYKIKNKIDVAYIRQNHLLFSQLKDIELKDDFFKKYYLSMYKWMIEEDKFNDFVYTVAFSIKNEKLKKVVDAKKKQITTFYEDFYTKFLSIVKKRNEEFRGKKQEVIYEFEDLKLVNIGQEHGAYDFYTKQGSISAQGSFDANDKKTGKWIWYTKDGKISETAYYKNGEVNGEYQEYYENGNLKISSVYKNDLLHGVYKFYNANGALIEEKIFKNDKLDGKYISNYSVGSTIKEYDIAYVNGEVQGNAVQFYENGEKKYAANFINNKREGDVYDYFVDGTVEKKYSYKDGVLSGKYLNYYSNGKIYEEGIYKSGLVDGVWKYYYVDGKPYKINEFSDGKSHGLNKEFTHLGPLLEEFQYKKDKLYKATYYDAKGNVLYSEKKDGRELEFKSYSILGKLTAEGLYNIKGGKQGVWNFYTKNGVLKSVEKYEDGKSTGEYINYYTGGQIKSKINYKDGALNGYAVYYYDNDQISDQGYYLEDNKDKEWRSYYVDGTINSIEYYHKGKLNGTQEYYNEEGKLQYVNTYNYGELIKEEYFSPKDGSLLTTIDISKLGNKPVVVEKKYFNGATRNKLTFLNGVLHGDYMYYYPDGKLQITGTYVNGKVDKEWKWYNSKGDVIKVANYLLGKLNGSYKKYYDTGKLASEKTYVLGQVNGKSISYAEDGKTITDIIEYLFDSRHGETKFYSTDGHLQLIRYYDMGTLLGYSYLDKNGELLKMIPIENESAKVVTYYDNGNKSREFEIKNGDFINNYVEYFYEGNIERKSTFFNDKEEGVYTRYYKNGNIKETSNYILGELNGPYKAYYSNGKLKKEYLYKNDEEIGVYKKYSEDGSIIEQGNCYGGEEFEEKI